MKKFTFILLFVLVSLCLHAQFILDNTITFETSDSLFQMGPAAGNCWQIGTPSKAIFNQAYSVPDAIVTDTLNSYPVNSFSTFTVKLYDPAWGNIWNPRTWVSFFHKYDTDTLHDGGYLEFSDDNGNTWTNIANIAGFEYAPGGVNPIIGNGNQAFTGRSYTNWNSSFTMWCYFPANLDSICLLRFVFYSDNTPENREGWMIDDIHISTEFCEGIQEKRNDKIISICPNPASDEITVKYPPKSHGSSVQIFDVTGKLTYQDYSFTEKSIDVSNLPNGIYLLKYSDNKYLSIKKFIVRH
ncbi:MAG: T9SS type A sorting domain-containing protein [Bacteroidetes bacterium]|nr:T9SS type A sorting domain-containing protein [Bacteroidota bacterium]